MDLVYFQRKCRCPNNQIDLKVKKISYFTGEACQNPTLQWSGATYELEIDWEKSFEITNREYIFMIVYAAVSGLWIASSLLIIRE